MDDKIKYVSALKTVKQIFDNHGIRFWLDYGTLLGAVREGKMIDHDYDIDLAVWINDVPKIGKTRKEFKKAGYTLYVNPNHGNYQIRELSDGTPVLPVKRIHHLLCILFRGKKEGYVTRLRLYPFVKALAFFNRTNRFDGFVSFVWSVVVRLKLYKYEWITSTLKDIGSFKTTVFYGDTFLIPEKPESYLEFLYGDWKTPIKGGAKEVGLKRLTVDDINERKKNSQNI